MPEANAKFSSLQIRVPTILDAEMNDESDISVSYVNLHLDTHHNEPHGVSDFSKYLDLDQVQHIVEFLEEAINFKDSLIDSDIHQEKITSHSYVKTLESDGDIEKDRVRLIGQITSSEPDSEDEIILIIDAARESDAPIMWTRLTFLDDAVSFGLSKNSTREMSKSLKKALEYINQNPPLMISNSLIGRVECLSKNGEKKQIEVEVEGAVFSKEAPCIALNVVEDVVCPSESDTWWLSDDEASKLVELLEAAIASETTKLANQYREKYIGCLAAEASNEPETIPWLNVTLQVRIQSDNIPELWVRLHFNDELTQEREDRGILWLTNRSIEYLIQLISEAKRFKRDFPSHIYVPPEPENIVVAEIPLIIIS